MWTAILLACADEHNQLWSIDVATKKVEVLVKDVEGNLLNGPNDLWVRPADGAQQHPRAAAAGWSLHRGSRGNPHTQRQRGLDPQLR